MLANRDYRHFDNNQNYSDGGYIEPRHGSKPTVVKSQLAGKCSHGYALFFINGNSFAEHIVTPIDTTEIANHKLMCSEGYDLTR